jgi:hypothetical protein
VYPDWVQWVLTLIWKSYVPIPSPSVAFWNTNILDDVSLHIGALSVSPVAAQIGLSIGLFGLASWLLIRTPIILVVYAFATLELLVFTYVRYFGGIRHGGHLFIVLVACLWLSLSRPGARDSRWLPVDVGLSHTARMALITLLLAVQLIAGVLAIRGDLRYSFSGAQDVAQFLKERHLTHLTMIGSKYYVAASVAFHLNRPVYYAEMDRMGTYLVWNVTRRPVTPDELARKAEEFAEQDRQDVLLVLNYDLGAAEERLGLIKVRSFNENIVSDERYVLYVKCYAQAGLSPPVLRTGSSASPNSRQERLCT